jgi:hypothetical protein
MATDIFITPTSGTVDFNNGVFGSVLGTIATMKVYDSLTSGNLSIQNSATSNLSGVKFLNRGNPGNVFEAYGTYGNLFTISDDLTDSIFSINNSAGLPVFDVYSNNSVYAGQYASGDFTISGNKIGIGTKTPSSKLQVIGTVTAPSFVGALTGNASTATILATARLIGGVSFNGSADITLPGVNSGGTQNTTGSSASCTGNAATATILQNARLIGGVSFNGSADITLPGVNSAGSQNTTGNAATATTTDNINGRAFYNRNSGNALAQDSYANNGIGYVTSVSLFSQSDGGMYASAYDASWVHQIYGDFRTGQIAIRGKNSGTWQAFRRVLDETNSPYAWAMNQNVGTTSAPVFNNVYEAKTAVAATATASINTGISLTELSFSANTTVSFTGIQATGTLHMWTIATVGAGTAYTVTWPVAVKWPATTAPTITSGSNKRDIYQFVTYDGGTSIYAIIVGQNL